MKQYRERHTLMFSTTVNAQRSTNVNISGMNVINAHKNGDSILSGGANGTRPYSATANSCDVTATSTHLSEKNALNSAAKDTLVYNVIVDTDTAGSSDMNAMCVIDTHTQDKITLNSDAREHTDGRRYC
eukprot:5845-Heterococcus_DN1.PRE.1